jgi:flagellar basal-body rod protein FlgB
VEFQWKNGKGSGIVASIFTSSISGMTSNSLRMMERSMDFLWAKQAAHLDNVANAETPGYKVKTVTFEERFRSKLRQARAKAVRLETNPRREYRETIEKTGWTVLEDEESARMDENGVNVTEQSLEAIRTAYQMQYTLQAISSDLSTLRAAITG